MRVTKNIREYIEKEVHNRLAPKYEAEKQKAKHQTNLAKEFRESCIKAAEQAFNDCFEKNFYKVAEFAEDMRPKDGIHLSFPCFLGLTQGHCSVFERMNSEVEKITNRIILELELGGNKAELMKMLDEIGQKED